MKKILFFNICFIFCLLQTWAAETKLAGFGNRKESFVSGFTAMNVYGMSLSSPDKITTYSSPFAHNNSNGIYPNGTTMRVLAGAWTGNTWITVAEVRQGEYSVLHYRYLSFDPVSKRTQFIGSGYLESNCKNYSDMTFDKTRNKIYAITNKCLYVANTTDTIHSLVDTIRVNGNILSASFRSIAADGNGVLYALASDSCLYTINKDNASAVKIANIGESVSENANFTYSSCFDMLNDSKLYWAKGEANEKIYSLNTNTGKLSLECHHGIRTAGIFHHYYTSLIPPENPSAVVFSQSAENQKQITISWKNPSLDFNGKPLSNLAKVYIYKGSRSDNLLLIDSVLTTEAGATKTYTISEEKNGIYYYGIQAVSTEGISSSAIQQEVIYCLDVNMPFFTSFEENEDLQAVATSGPDWDTTSLANYVLAGQRAYRGLKQASGGELSINGLSVEKGATYYLTFGMKSASTSLNLQVNIGDKIITQTPTSSWKNYSFSYTPSKSGKISISFLVKDNYCYSNCFLAIDSLSFYKAVPNTVPDSVVLLSVQAAPMGELKANLAWINPNKTTGGENLAQISKVIIQKSTSRSFTASTPSDTIITHFIGDTVRASLALSGRGTYYFRLTPLNDSGISPYSVISPLSPYIGIDSTPQAPSTAEIRSLQNGSILISWNKVPDVPSSGGYFAGNISGYEVSRALAGRSGYTYDTLHSANDTSLLISDLELGFYQLDIKAIRNHSNKSIAKSVYGIAGLTNALSIAKSSENSNTHVHPFHQSTYPNMQSSVSQSIYTAKDLGKAGFINSLHFFNYAQDSIHRPIKIYLGSIQDSLFAQDTSWLNLDDPKNYLVYSDSLKFLKPEQVLSIPIKPYFYDGKSSLVLSIVRPIQNKTPGTNTYYNSGFDAKKALYLKSDKIDFDTVIKLSSIKGSVQNSVPVMVIGNSLQLASLIGNIYRKADNSLLQDVLISISPNAQGTGYPLEYEFSNDQNGHFLFDQMPSNIFDIRFSKPGFIDTIITLSVSEPNTYNVDIYLDDAEKISLDGKVVNAKNEALSGVKIILSGSRQDSTLSDAQGIYRFDNLYNGGIYTLTFENKHYKTKELPILLGDKDSTLQNLHLEHLAYPISSLSASIVSKQVQLTWYRPLAEDKLIKPLGGYLVYRLKAEDSISPKNWDLLTPEAINDTSFTDIFWQEATYGVYLYAVQADYMNNIQSKAFFTQKLRNKMEFTIGVKLSTNGDHFAGAIVQLKNIENDEVYSQTVSKEGIATFNPIVRGLYSLSCTLKNHVAVNIPSINIDKDSLIHAPVLKQIISKPYINSVSGEETMDLVFNWQILSAKDWADDFESYQDFQIDSFDLFIQSPFISKGGLQSYQWPNMEKEQAFIVFNHQACQPSLNTKEWGSYSGIRSLTAFYAQTPPNKDYLIHPVLEGGGRLTFFAKGIGSDGKKEVFSVLYSNSSFAENDFMPVAQGENIEASSSWKEYSFTIPNQAKYLAIKYQSSDLMALQIDDISFMHREANISHEAPVLKYYIFLNNQLFDSVDANTYSYQFPKLQEGEYRIGLSALYASGPSKQVSRSVYLKTIAIEKQNKAHSISISPNPSPSGKYMLHLDNDYSLEVMNSHGSLLFRKNLAQGNQWIDLESYPKGLYFFLFKKKDQQYLIKVIR